MQDLWKHQLEAITRAREPRFPETTDPAQYSEVIDLALFMDPGVGKTRTLIEILRERYTKSLRLKRTLILAPLIVTAQWKREFLKFSKIPEDRIFILNKSATRMRDLERATIRPGGAIIVTNYEAVLNKNFREKLYAWAPEIVVYDESHRMKDPQSKRFSYCKPLSDGAENRYLMTGSPVLNNPMDLWAQFRLMDLGKAFGDNFFVFRGDYFWDQNAGMPAQRHFADWQIRRDMIPKIRGLVSQNSVQARKEDCLSLPPLLEVLVPVELGALQGKAYKEMERDFITRVKNKTIVAQLAITATIRLQQILSGFVDDKKGSPDFFEENPRLETMSNLLEDILPTGKVLIWTNFVPSYHLIGKRLTKMGVKHVFITGQESLTEKLRSVEAIEKGDIQVAVCNAAAAGLGIDLITPKYSIYYTRSYSREHLIQSRARNHRGGSEIHDKITHYHLIIENTLDEVIWKCLEGKGDIARAIMQWGEQGSL